MAHLDPFLHDWDERYHALVARNMMQHPFTPMLRVSDALYYNFEQWCCNHIWLHKQPLFLWQMALSMKIFGVSEYAIRYPGVLMGSLGVLMVYRIAFLMAANRTIAFIAGLLACFPYYHLELLAGLYGMDQNDIAFDFYVLCSVWAYAEYNGRKWLRYALLAGLFAGCAILNKWLMGGLVFSTWGVLLLCHIRRDSFKKEALHLLSALLVCVAVALPWQLYILHAFPVEAKYEFALNSRHIFEAVEHHVGDNWYYLDMFKTYFC
jgi:4-amino-4-deoxy-L-arabinose transferase-like glycosyltransferase